MVTEELLARVREAGLCVVVRSPVAATQLARVVGRQLRVPVRPQGEATVAGGPVDAAMELSIGSTAGAAIALLVCPSGAQLDAVRFQRDVLEPLRSAASETGGTCTADGGDVALLAGTGGALRQATFLPSGQVLSLYEQGAAEAAETAMAPSGAAPSQSGVRFLMVAGIVAVVVVAGVVAAVVVLLSRPSSSTSVDNTPTGAGSATPDVADPVQPDVAEVAPPVTVTVPDAPVGTRWRPLAGRSGVLRSSSTTVPFAIEVTDAYRSGMIPRAGRWMTSPSTGWEYLMVCRAVDATYVVCAERGSSNPDDRGHDAAVLIRRR